MIVVEGLGTGLVGAYGSSTAITPAIDSLAAKGVLLDQCFVDSQNLQLQLASLWTARHALQATQATEPKWNLWQAASERENAAWGARLFTDCELVATAADEYGCPTVTLVEPTLPNRPASDSSQCSLMSLFAAAAEELASGDPGLLWIHSRGLRLPWDAPLDLRAKFADPEDPLPPSEIEPPACDVGPQSDPDQWVGWGQVAAAQCAVIDEAISALLHTVAGRSDAALWSWLLTSLGGVPLGEHGRIGWGRPQLFGEELHTATIIVPVPPLPIGVRRPELFQLPDIAASVAELLAIDVATERSGQSGEHSEQSGGGDNGGGLSRAWGHSAIQYGAAESPQRWPNELSLAMIASDQQVWLRTPAWSSVLPIAPAQSDSPGPDLTDHGHIEPEPEKLFVKPEDRWEVNNIADRRRDIVVRHHELAQVFGEAAKHDDRSRLPTLEDDLTSLLR